MKKLMFVLVVSLAATACANKKKGKHDHANLEKFPHCYHDNVKISNACIQKNLAGENVTAMQLENAAYPGQYK
jgi:hypothetical protein